jgi:hypothetical protein
MMTHLEEVSATGNRRPPARSVFRTEGRDEARGEERSA